MFFWASIYPRLFIVIITDDRIIANLIMRVLKLLKNTHKHPCVSDVFVKARYESCKNTNFTGRKELHEFCFFVF